MHPNDQVPTFNLKAVVQETGLKPDTLRAWERRYNLPQPERTSGGHRLYSQRDIDILKWLVARQKEGLSISRAVNLWRQLETEGTDPLLSTTQPAAVTAVSAMSPTVGETLTELRQTWISACLDFDEQKAEYCLTQAFALYPPETVCFELLVGGLSSIGQGWYKGEITVQQEHFASALAVRRLETLLAAAPPPTRPNRLLVGCPPEEEHIFSPLLITLLLRRQGWEVLYLGANVPVARLEETIASAEPDLVILSAQQLPTAATLLEMAQLLRQEQVLLAFGGQIFNRVPLLRNRIPGYFLGERLDLIPKVVEKLLTTPEPLPSIEEPSEAYQQSLSHYRERKALVEADVWQALEPKEKLSHEHLNIANTNLARHIIAGLKLGDMDFLGVDITWAEGLLINYGLSTQLLVEYLDTYQQVAKKHLNGPGEPIINWLAQLYENGAKIEST